MAPKVVLTYFGVRARAELIRLILKAGGVDFEDNRLTQEEWPALKQGEIFLCDCCCCWKVLLLLLLLLFLQLLLFSFALSASHEFNSGSIPTFSVNF